ncbi:ABC-2 type transport system permease protein [Devosia lucknowensis]|uniref:ABC-2 type transport system permease protein n=1 Tax=Devosia lucknowensis TaxID=1096929 RepID=A0A1Y6FCB7_9HYPH|nr:ABC-2 family transporter protein [Devosia lucknowensis]SMQ71231.1 ABC-2 type transport system permease protein [Devosia lucknowensis]
MRASAYPAFTTTAFLSRLAYRNEVWSGLFGELVTTFAYIAVWTAGLAAVGSVDGVTLPEMITYVLIAGPLLNWNTTRFIREVGGAVRTGDVTVFLLKPLHYPALLMSNQLGSYAFDFLAIFLPVALIVGVSFGLLPPASMGHGILFLGYWIVSWLMLFMIATCVSLLAFWILTAFALDWFLRGIMAVASGGVIPLWFMPSAIANILGYLPFAWVSYYPAAVYLGKLDLASAGLHLLIGGAWLLAMTGFVAWLWSRARHRLIVQGG